MTRLGALVRGGVEGVVGTLAMDLLWYPSGLLIRTRPLPQTGIGGKNDHVVDQSGPTYCHRVSLSGLEQEHSRKSGPYRRFTLVIHRY